MVIPQSDIDKILVEAECPACGVKAKYRVEKYGYTLVRCDSDSGGCEDPFVLYLETTIKVKVYEVVDPNHKFATL